MSVTILRGDCRLILPTLPAESVQCVVTSPPFWQLRDYGCDGQIGLERTPEEYVGALVGVFREVSRVLRSDGTLWLNLGDTYARSPQKGDNSGWGKHAAIRDFLPGHNRPMPNGLKEKDLVGIPWMVAFALRADGWWLRSECIWDKPNSMPSSVTDRPSVSHETVFLLAKSERYFYDQEAVREPHSAESLARAGRSRSDNHKWVDGPGGQTLMSDLTHACHAGGRNKRTVWRVNTSGYPGAHYATFPAKLVIPMILAGTSEGGCCPTCSAPHARITEKGEPLIEQQQACGGDQHGAYHGKATKDYPGARAQDPSATKARILAGMVERRTVGWRATCDCPAADPVPCTVLDPFAGSGTVGEAATKLGRNAILIELSEAYADQAAARNAQGGLFT